MGLATRLLHPLTFHVRRRNDVLLQKKFAQLKQVACRAIIHRPIHVNIVIMDHVPPRYGYWRGRGVLRGRRGFVGEGVWRREGRNIRERGGRMEGKVVI